MNRPNSKDDRITLRKTSSDYRLLAGNAPPRSLRRGSCVRERPRPTPACDSVGRRAGRRSHTHRALVTDQFLGTLWDF